MKPNGSLFIPFLALAFYLAGFAGLHAQVWNREVIDSTGINNGQFCSLKLDKNNIPHLAYMDADYYDLKYATKSGGKWVVSVLDSIRYTGVSADLALDSKNQPHICFQEGCEMSGYCPEAGLKYMTKTTGGWVKESVDEYFVMTGGTDQTYCSIQLTSSDKPVIAYYKIGVNAIQLASREDAEWTIREYPVSSVPIYIDLVLKSDDSPVVMCMTNDSLHIAVFNQGTNAWDHHGTAAMPFTMMFAEVYLFDIDQDDNLHIIYPSFESMIPQFKYVSFNWKDWSAETLTGGGPYYIKVDNTNVPYLLNLEGSNGLSLCSRQENQWECEDVDPDIYTVAASIDFDEQNYAHIAMYGKLPETSSIKSGTLIYYNYCPGLPDMEIDPPAIDFLEVWTKSYADQQFVIRNKGIAPLAVSNLEFEVTSAFKLLNVPKTAIIPVGDSLVVTARFTPSEASIYSETLQLVTNDVNYPLVDIQFTGTGISSGTTANLVLTVNNVYADMQNLLINKNTPLAGAKLTLFQNDIQVKGTRLTNEEGIANFPDLTPGFYEIRVEKIPEYPGRNLVIQNRQIAEIGPGTNSRLLYLPDSLYKYKYRLIDTLNEIEESEYILTGEYFTYEKAETSVEAEMANWATNLDPARIESLARLILVEEMVRDLYEEGVYISNEMYADFGDLIGFIYYMDDWGMSLITFLKTAIKTLFSSIGGGASGARELFLELLEKLINMAIKQEILDAITRAVDMVGAELPHPGDIILSEAWSSVKNNYSSTPNLSFGVVGWDNIRHNVKLALMGPFIQDVYIDLLTSPVIEKGLSYSMENEHNGTFEKALRRETQFVSGEKNEVEVMITAAGVLRTTANMFMLTANLLNVVEIADETGIASLVNQLTNAMKLAAYTEVVIALGLSTTEFFLLPAGMDNAVDDIYLPDTKKAISSGPSVSEYPRSRYGLFSGENIKTSLQAARDSYDSLLLVIKDKIIAGERQDAALELFDLMDIEEEYRDQLRQAYAPATAVAREANEMLPSFPAMYDSLITYDAETGQERFINSLRIFCMVFDTTGHTTNEAIGQIDKTIASQHKLTAHVSGMLDVISAGMELPGIVVASKVTQDAQSLNKDESATITLRFKNVGAVTASNIWFKINTNEALSFAGPDSIIIGSLDPGEESSEFSFEVNLSSVSFNIALWDAELRCDGAVVNSPSGSFRINESTTKIDETGTPRESGFYCVPNPVNTAGIIYCNLATSAKLKIDLYDISGRKIKTLLDDYREAGVSRLPWSAEGLTGGLYLIKVHVGDNIPETIKVMVNGEL